MESRLFTSIELLISNKFKLLMIPILITTIVVIIFYILNINNYPNNKKNFFYSVDFIEQEHNITRIDLVNFVLNLPKYNELTLNYFTDEQDIGFFFFFYDTNLNEYQSNRSISQIDLFTSFINKINYLSFQQINKGEVNLPKDIMMFDDRIKGKIFKLEFHYEQSDPEISKINLLKLIDGALEQVNAEWINIINNRIDDYSWKVNKYYEYYDSPLHITEEKDYNIIQLGKNYARLKDEIIQKNISSLFIDGKMVDVLNLVPMQTKLIYKGHNDNVSLPRLFLAVYFFMQFCTILLFFFITEFKKFRLSNS